MTNPTESVTSAEDQWLMPASSPTEPAEPAAAAAGRRGAVVRGGLVVAGAVVGALAVVTVGSSASDGTTPVNPAGLAQQGTLPNGAPPNGTLPNGTLPNGGFGGAAPFDRGGFDGEEHVGGSLVSVAAGTVTVRTSDGRTTYRVTDATQIVRNGQPATLDDLRAGDPVFLHVLTAGTGHPVLERLLAG